jgi:hypothetical protein
MRETHVRWCGRVPGRNPPHPTRSAQGGLFNSPSQRAPSARMHEGEQRLEE